MPSAGIASADFGSYPPGFEFTNRAVPGNTCVGHTYEDLPGGATANPLYTERITNGVYNLPGDTGYYGSDSNGTAVIGAAGGVGALQNIDSGCGETGKLVYDAASLADPEIDFSDYDTDKDGLVDFFMVVFAGCGGHGASQLSIAGCAYPGAPYDNVWPHSSSLEYGYSDPVTGKPGFVTDDQLKTLKGEPLWYTDTTYTTTTTTPGPDNLKVFVRVGPYNVNPETAIDFASVISHEYGHSLGLPDFYSTGTRETYGDWNLMATDKSQNMDAYSRQELGWVVPEVLDSSRPETGITDSKQDINEITWQKADGTPYTLVEGQSGVAGSRTPRCTPPSCPADGCSTRRRSPPVTARPPPTCGGRARATTTAALPMPVATSTCPSPSSPTSRRPRWSPSASSPGGTSSGTTTTGSCSRPPTAGTPTPRTSRRTATRPPGTQNPNANQCMTTYGNGITGSSGSYEAGTAPVDRVTSTYPAPVFLEDAYDISDLAGEPHAALRFSYATDPGLARPGWFIDDVTITVDEDGPGRRRRTTSWRPTSRAAAAPTTAGVQRRVPGGSEHCRPVHAGVEVPPGGSGVRAGPRLLHGDA